ncbi:hypothetical protein DL96DRAFT_1811000 [Flagelloscypha sp. PMI_526]|nr:hypothetical protein DL96DRAFT_1811000 [Flagelloscypha sp. PMI_526]
MVTHVLVMGATGLVGGPFIHELLARSKIDDDEEVKVSAFVRSSSKAKQTLPSSVTLVDGLDIESQAGLARIEELSAQSDFRFKATGKLGKLIHISGTFNFITPAPGGVVDEEKKRLVDDSRVEDLALISKEYGNGPADHLAAGNIDGYIICPSGIYGTYGSLLGLFTSFYFAYAQQHGAVSYVHLDDLLDLIFKVYDLAHTSTDPQRARYYIATSHRFTTKEIAQLSAPLLFDAGIVSSPDAKSVGVDTIGNGPLDM